MTVREAYDVIQRDYDCDAHRETTSGSCSLDCINCPNYIPLTVLEEAYKRIHKFVGEVLEKIESAESHQVEPHHIETKLLGTGDGSVTFIDEFVGKED